MKKFLLFTLIFAMIMSAIPVSAAENTVTVTLNGEVIDCRDVNGNEVPPMLIDGTTYLPVRAIVTALELDITWHDETKSVFINGEPENAEKSDNVNIYINGEKFTAKDATGKVVYPILKDGTTYLPIRAVGEAFGQLVNWDDATKTAILTTPEKTLTLEDGKVYAFLNKANGKAISVTDNGLALTEFYHYDFQGFKLIKSDVDDYYYIQSVSNGKNFDVNGNSKAAGGSIITYNAGTADNQKFKIEKTEDGYIIYALSSLLPIEDSAGSIKQNEKRQSLVQKWDIVEITPVEKIDETTYYFIYINGGGTLYDTGIHFSCGEVFDYTEAELWSLTPNEDGEYIITSLATGKSLDVANNSTTSGDPIIVYDTSGDPNQCWIFEKQSDGTYLIKSVHSGLYLSIASDGSVIQAELNTSYKQNWTLSVY